jgi:DNA repair exonuclease SbcCD ATPase subunit
MLQHELELKDDRIAQLEAEYSSILPIRNELETLRAQLEAADAAGAQWQTVQHDLEALRTEVHTAKDETSDSGRPESGSIVIDGARDPRTAREFDAAVNPVHLAIQVLRELKARLRAAEDAVGILKQRMSSARMSHAENESELEGLRAMVDNGNRDLSDLMKENTHLRESLEHAQAATHRMRDRQREMQSNLDMARAKSAQVNQLAAQLMGSLQGKDHVLAKQLFEKQAETDQLWQSMAQQRDASRTDMKDVGKPAGQSPLELLRAWANYLESTILLSDEEVSHACIACVRMNRHNAPAYHDILCSSRLPDVVHTCVSSRAAALHRRTARASARRPASCCG